MAGAGISQDAVNTISNDNYESKLTDNGETEENVPLEDNDKNGLPVMETSMTNSRLELHRSSTSSPSGVGNTYMKEVIASLHRATMASAMSGIAIRDAALVSLVNIVESENTENICDISGHTSSASSCQYSLIVLQVGLHNF